MATTCHMSARVTEATLESLRRCTHRRQVCVRRTTNVSSSMPMLHHDCAWIKIIIVTIHSVFYICIFCVIDFLTNCVPCGLSNGYISTQRDDNLNTELRKVLFNVRPCVVSNRNLFKRGEEATCNNSSRYVNCRPFCYQ